MGGLCNRQPHQLERLPAPELEGSTLSCQPVRGQWPWEGVGWGRLGMVQQAGKGAAGAGGGVREGEDGGSAGVGGFQEGEVEAEDVCDWQASASGRELGCRYKVISIWMLVLLLLTGPGAGPHDRVPPARTAT